MLLQVILIVNYWMLAIKLLYYSLVSLYAILFANILKPAMQRAVGEGVVFTLECQLSD